MEGRSTAPSSCSAPSSPSSGNLWFNTTTGALYEYQYDGTSYYWVDVTGPTAANTSTLSSYQIVNGNSNIAINTANGNITMGVTGTANVVTVSSSGMTVVGNVSATYFIGNGSLLTGISGSGSNYSNANVAAYLPTYSGNISAGNISATGNITGSYILGNGSQLTGISASGGASNARVMGYSLVFGG